MRGLLLHHTCFFHFLSCHGKAVRVLRGFSDDTRPIGAAAAAVMHACCRTVCHLVLDLSKCPSACRDIPTFDLSLDSDTDAPLTDLLAR
jgi:hypothetical protein